MAEKTENKRQPSKLTRMYRETMGELRKVTWPTPKEAWSMTKIVLMVLLVMALFLGMLDFGFSKLVTLLVA